MKSFRRAFICELIKALHSKVTLLVAVAASIGPLVSGVFMLILKNPEQAREMGIIGTKARLAGSADWQSLLGMLMQTTIAGSVIFAFMMAWIFGREFSDRTTRLWLAVPTPRSAVVAAKLIVSSGWSAILVVWMFLLGVIMGFIVDIPGFSEGALLDAAISVAVTGLMTIALLLPVAFIASIGRGYLSALGYALLTLAIAQIAGALGWGAVIPWSVPALYCGAAGSSKDLLGVESYIIVALTSLAGLIGTLIWWKQADQTR